MSVKNSGERSQELVSWDHLGRKEREKSSIAWPGSGQKKYPPKNFFLSLGVFLLLVCFLFFGFFFFGCLFLIWLCQVLVVAYGI